MIDIVLYDVYNEQEKYYTLFFENKKFRRQNIVMYN